MLSALYRWHCRYISLRYVRPLLTLLQADDELDLPVLAGFEWDPEECYTRFVVHQKKEGAAAPSKKKKKGGDE